jgi:hypothetical protein
MTKQSENTESHIKDWRIVLGLVITTLWLLLGYLYIFNNASIVSFSELPIDEMGSFLEGAFAPLAFLWLVIGLFIQQSVLAENNAELRRNNLHSEKQTQAIAATELNARQGTFFKIAENTRRQLGSIAGILFISSQGPVGNNKYSAEEIAELWKQFASGDFEVFPRLFLISQDSYEEELCDLFYETDIRKKHTENYIVGFDRLLRLAKECDNESIIADTLIYSAHGILNIRMRDLHPNRKFEAISSTYTNEHLNQYSTDC